MSPKKFYRLVFAIFSVSLLGASSLSSGEEAKAPASVATPESPLVAESAAVKTPTSSALMTGATPGCLVDQTVLTDVQNRLGEIAKREEAAATRETELDAREKALDEELAKIAGVRDEVAKIEQLRKKEGQEKVLKLVETIQGMSPKAASQLLSTVDEVLAVSAIAQMETKKLSKIMNVMEPERSARLSEILAGVTRAKGGWKQSSQYSTSNGVAAVASPGKGGEIKNGNVDNNSSSNPEQSSGSLAAAQKGK